MKKLFFAGLLLLLPLAAGCAGFFDPGYIKALYRDAGEQLLALEEEKNLAYSPSAAALCGALLCAGASEEEAAACAGAFGAEKDVLTENSVKALSFMDKPAFAKQGLRFSGAFWHRSGTPVSDEYKKTLESYFGAKPLAFGGGAEINKYFEELGFASKEECDDAALLTCAAFCAPVWDACGPETARRVDRFRPFRGQAKPCVFFPVGGKVLFGEIENGFFASVPFAGGAMRLDIFCADNKKALLEAVEDLAKGHGPAEYAKERDMWILLPETVVESREEPLLRLGKKGLRTLGYSGITGRRPVPVENMISRGALRLAPGGNAAPVEAEEEAAVTRPFLFLIRDAVFGLPVLAGICAVL